VSLFFELALSAGSPQNQIFAHFKNLPLMAAFWFGIGFSLPEAGLVCPMVSRLVCSLDPHRWRGGFRITMSSGPEQYSLRVGLTDPQFLESF
jgi:hypothetical protein